MASPEGGCSSIIKKNESKRTGKKYLNKPTVNSVSRTKKIKK